MNKKYFHCKKKHKIHRVSQKTIFIKQKSQEFHIPNGVAEIISPLFNPTRLCFESVIHESPLSSSNSTRSNLFNPPLMNIIVIDTRNIITCPSYKNRKSRKRKLHFTQISVFASTFYGFTGCLNCKLRLFEDSQIYIV